jgi:predicted transcriptional regulator
VSIADQILISLEARHAENILQGKKRVEFRRRPMNVEAGALIWIYAKLPVGSIVGCATVAAVREQAPSTLWRKFGSRSGISRIEFFQYFAGVTQGVALELTGCRRLGVSVPLESLRRFSAGFQPPQFFARLRQGAPLLAAISQLGTPLGAATNSVS